MHYNSIPEKPLKAGAGKVETNQRVYFFERADGSTISVSAKEAWGLINRPQKSFGTYNVPLRFLGSSNGTIYQKGVIECQKCFAETGDLAEAQKILRKAEADELAAARGNMVYPPNYDMVDSRGNPTTINQIMGSNGLGL